MRDKMIDLMGLLIVVNFDFREQRVDERDSRPAGGTGRDIRDSRDSRD